MAAPAGSRTPLQGLIETLMQRKEGEEFSLERWITDERAAGRTPQWVAVEVYARTGRVISAETVRAWTHRWEESRQSDTPEGGSSS
jgi:hypothetical protein